MAQIQITLVRSLIGRPENQRQSVKTLGLSKLRQSVVREDNAATRGLINTVSHLVEIKEV